VPPPPPPSPSLLGVAASAVAGIDVAASAMAGIDVAGIDVAKVAVTDFAAVIVSVQVPVPAHPPDQPVKVDPLFAEAAKVADFPDS
jgi:hypothetical protein